MKARLTSAQSKATLPWPIITLSKLVVTSGSSKPVKCRLSVVPTDEGPRVDHTVQLRAGQINDRGEVAARRHDDGVIQLHELAQRYIGPAWSMGISRMPDEDMPGVRESSDP